MGRGRQRCSWTPPTGTATPPRRSACRRGPSRPVRSASLAPGRSAFRIDEARSHASAITNFSSADRRTMSGLIGLRAVNQERGAARRRRRPTSDDGTSCWAVSTNRGRRQGAEDLRLDDRVVQPGRRRTSSGYPSDVDGLGSSSRRAARRDDRRSRSSPVRAAGQRRRLRRATSAWEDDSHVLASLFEDGVLGTSSSGSASTAASRTCDASIDERRPRSTRSCPRTAPPRPGCRFARPSTGARPVRRGREVTGSEESAGRSRAEGCRPRATISAPSAATIAPLSVHSPGRGTRTRMPCAAARSSASTRSREFAATPPPIRMSSTPSLAAASTALRVSTSHDRLLERRGHVGDRAPAHRTRSRASTHRATAVLSPENEKSKRCRSRSRRDVRPRGKSIVTDDPDRASRSMCGPPGNGRPSSRATLSNASPAASSIVAPERHDAVVRAGHVADPQQRRVPAADQQRDARLGQRAVLELVDGDVRGEVVHAVERLAEPDRQRLGGGDPDQQRAGETRARWSPRSRRRRAARRPASSQARSIVGTIASRCARDATSGTTPPNRACSSTLEATASASRVWPRTMPTPVSSHEVSMPSTRGWSVMSAIVSVSMHHGVGAVAVVARAAGRSRRTPRRRRTPARRCCPAPTSSSIRPSGRRPRRSSASREALPPVVGGDGDPLQVHDVPGRQRHDVADDLRVARDHGGPPRAGELVARPSRSTRRRRRTAPASSAVTAATSSTGRGTQRSRDPLGPARRGDVRAAQVERLRVEQLGPLVGDHLGQRTGVRVLGPDGARERTPGRARRRLRRPVRRSPRRPASRRAARRGARPPRRTTPSRPPCDGRPSRPGTARPRRPRRRPAQRARRACTRRTPGRRAPAPACAR